MLDPTFVTASTDVVLSKLNSSPSGLSEYEVAKRRREYGSNAINHKESSWIAILLRQFTSSFVYLLIAASIISIALGEFIDSVMIFLFLAINTTLGFYQEYRSEQIVKLLRKYFQPDTVTVRGGRKQNVPTVSLVPGDIVQLTAGDNVPADVRFISATNLEIDESILTGESVPVSKDADINTNPKATTNIGFSATTVVSGKATGVVIATGDGSTYAHIARLVSQTPKKSIFQKEIDAISRFTLILISVTLLFVFAVHLIIKVDTDAARLALFSVALAVSVIPEALPLVTTFSLSIGAIKLAKQKVVVKRLSAIEDLGSIEVLCSDKTGTLTENRLRVEGWFGGNRDTILLYCALGISEDGLSGRDPFYTAILEAQDSTQILHSYRLVEYLPFDPVHRRTTTRIAHQDMYEIVSLGAPEAILSLCSIQDTQVAQNNLEWLTQEGKAGRRVLAVARKHTAGTSGNLRLEEVAMEFVGMVSFTDPLKLSAKEAVAQANKLGVTVKILTGDSKEVAATVAHQIGLISDPGHCITGDEFDALDAQGQKRAVDTYSVFARVTPIQKHMIVELLESEHEVGFLGEGINDAPALKAANVAIAVAGAADIAREASDIILLEKSLAVIVNGIRQGRSVFINTTKYITATIAANFGNFFAVVFVSLVIPYLPMLPLQILLINLLSDFPMIAVATDRVDVSDIRKPQRYNIRKFAFFALLLGIVSTLFDFLLFAVFGGRGESILQTNWYIGSILTELVFLFSVRTKGFFLRGQKPSGVLVFLSLTAALVTVLIPMLPVGQSIFRFHAPTIQDLTTIGFIVLLYLAATEGVKRLYYGFRLDTKSVSAS